MINTKALIKWLLVPWPFWAIAGVIGLHYQLIICFPSNIVQINKIAATVLQVVGGLIVLYSINQNIGLFRGQNVITAALGWLISFPLVKRNINLKVESLTSTLSLSGELSITRKCDTVEEKLAELQRQIDECRETIVRKEKKINERISAVEGSLSNRIEKNDAEIERVRSLLHDSVVGGIATQVFGVLLVLYGGVLGLL